MNYYAGIGRRDASPLAKQAARAFATAMSQRNWTLRSGGAAGADSAFESGASQKEIFLPASANDQAIELAKQFHPAWHRCSYFAKAAHGRNAMILLGADLKKPVKFVAFLSRPGEVDVLDGGTGLALKIAKANDIPCYHLNMSVSKGNIDGSVEQLVNNILEEP